MFLNRWFRTYFLVFLLKLSDTFAADVSQQCFWSPFCSVRLSSLLTLVRMKMLLKVRLIAWNHKHHNCHLLLLRRLQRIAIAQVRTMLGLQGKALEAAIRWRQTLSKCVSFIIRYFLTGHLCLVHDVIITQLSICVDCSCIINLALVSIIIVIIGVLSSRFFVGCFPLILWFSQTGDFLNRSEQLIWRPSEKCSKLEFMKNSSKWSNWSWQSYSRYINHLLYWITATECF